MAGFILNTISSSSFRHVNTSFFKVVLFCFKTPARNNKRKRNFIIVNKHYDYVNEILIMFKNVISIETKAIMLMNIIFNANIFNDYGYDFNVFRFA